MNLLLRKSTMTKFNNFTNPVVKAWDRVRVLLFKKRQEEYTDWATIVEKHWELYFRFDDAETHSDDWNSYVLEAPITQYSYRLLDEWELIDM